MYFFFFLKVLMTHDCKENHCLDVSLRSENGRQCGFVLAGELFLKEHNKSGSDAIDLEKPKYLAYQIDTLLKELNSKFKQEMQFSLNFLCFCSTIQI